MNSSSHHTAMNYGSWSALSADNELVKEPKTPTWSRHQKLSETVIEKKVLDASAAMDSGCLSESNDANAAHEMYEKFLTK